ncbi:hemerythrin domain-containing protein [bacterium]|jgi:hemerythrin-like domain-containing protein|nr:hemerythrin domain-containing protein [bacterium]
MLNPFVAELSEDHFQIEVVLDALERELAPTLPIPEPFLSQAIQFLHEFGDEYHHFKEEEVFFPFLASQGVRVEAGPIARMLGDHAELRRLLAGIVDLLPLLRKQEQRTARALRQLVSRYVRLLRNHIEEEESMQYELSQSLLNEDTGLMLSDIVGRRVANRVSAARLAELRSFAAACQQHVELDECYSLAKV